jgi:hypothetical protein
MFLALYIFTTLIFSFGKVEQTWKKSLSKDGVVVYTRAVDYSPIKEFLAEAIMEGSIEKFRKIISNPSLHSKWLPNCIETRLLASSEDSCFIYHMMLRVPFPFENRDLVQKLHICQSDNIMIVNIINAKEKIPEQKNFVRIPEIGGHWRIEELEDGKIKVQFQYFADPGGRIPAWLVNTFVVKNPYKTLTNLRKLMAE